MFSAGRKLGLLAKRHPYNLYLMWLKRNYHVFYNMEFGGPWPKLDSKALSPELALIGQDVKASSASRVCVHWCIGEHESCPRGNEGSDVAQKIGPDGDAICEVLQIGRTPADAGHGNPIAAASRIHRRKRGIHIGTRQPLE